MRCSESLMLLLCALFACGHAPPEPTDATDPPAAAASASPAPDQADTMSYQDLADHVAAALPEADRAEGARILAEEILPRELVGLPYHPKPARLAEVVGTKLSEELAAAPESERLDTLRMAASRALVKEAQITSLKLAVARFLLDNPGKAEAAGMWADGMVAKWQELGVGGIALEASDRLDTLESWRVSAQSQHPDVWASYRTQYNHSKLNLQSARSGSFDTAAGSLGDFLREVGAPAEVLNVH